MVDTINASPTDDSSTAMREIVREERFRYKEVSRGRVAIPPTYSPQGTASLQLANFWHPPVNVVEVAQSINMHQPSQGYLSRQQHS
ncbi:hypothetical protein HPB50_027450 [Hyalomma asiaticum]|uniref:Uncharacterized protein n=1 Tax=Hyalomma asiaticum TaxID=266040 RepID=A0ACB7S5Q4_HYAAI|nr:hypothetical protein HPB50_027450 [Hyalomma asiaticum]